MKDPMKNAERLAALLDGRLDAHRRDELLAELAASEDDFDAYADAVAITSELEGAAPEVTPIHAVPEVRKIPVAPEVTQAHAASEVTPTPLATEVPPAQADPEVTPIHAAPSRRRGLSLRWLALAAVLAGVALAPWLWTRFAAGGGDLVAVEADALPAGWDASPWGTTRGAGDGLTDDARAVRLGARLVDLEIAVRGRDPATAQLATETAILLEGVSAAAPTGIYHAIARRAGEPAERLQPLLDEGREQVPMMAGEEQVKLGAWIESARIAAATRDHTFFGRRANRTQLKRMAGDASLPPAARSTAARLRIMVEAASAQDWGMLERELAGLLRVLGR